MPTEYRLLNRIFDSSGIQPLMLLTVFILSVFGFGIFTSLIHHVDQYKYFKHLGNVSIPTKCFVKSHYFKKESCSLYYSFWKAERGRNNSCYKHQYWVRYRIKNSSQITSELRTKTFKFHKKEVRK